MILLNRARITQKKSSDIRAFFEQRKIRLISYNYLDY